MEKVLQCFFDHLLSGVKRGCVERGKQERSRRRCLFNLLVSILMPYMCFWRSDTGVMAVMMMLKTHHRLRVFKNTVQYLHVPPSDFVPKKGLFYATSILVRRRQDPQPAAIRDQHIPIQIPARATGQEQNCAGHILRLSRSLLGYVVLGIRLLDNRCCHLAGVHWQSCRSN